MEIDERLKEQLVSIQQLHEEINKVKSSTSKEMRLYGEQKQQSERSNDELRNVFNLIAFEEAKLAKGEVDE